MTRAWGSCRWGDDPAAHGVTDMPEQGYYASYHGDVIAEQLRSLTEAAVDFVVPHWHIGPDGLDSLELTAVEHLFGVAAETGFPARFALQLCLGKRRRDDVADARWACVRDACTRRAAYLHRDGRPVLLRAPWMRLPGTAGAGLRFLAQQTDDFLRIATYGTAGSPTGLFAGRCPAPLLPRRSVSRDRHHRGLRVVTASPGWDGSHRKAGLFPVLRDEGHRLQQLERPGPGNPPDLVVIATFNNYHDNTHIEPSQQHGSLYLTDARVHRGGPEGMGGTAERWAAAG